MYGWTFWYSQDHGVGEALILVASFAKLCRRLCSYLERKSEVFDCFRDLKGFVETESGRKIKCLRLDGGKEYFSGQFNGYLQQMGIRREFNCRYTSEQNGVAERKNRSVVEAAQAMLEEKSLPSSTGPRR